MKNLSASVFLTLCFSQPQWLAETSQNRWRRQANKHTAPHAIMLIEASLPRTFTAFVRVREWTIILDDVPARKHFSS